MPQGALCITLALDVPPLLDHLVLRGTSATLIARPNTLGWFVALGGATLLLIGTGAVVSTTHEKGWVLVFWVLALAWLSLAAFSLVAYRASYRLTLDFGQKTVRVVDVRGFDPAAGWSGGFGEIQSVAFLLPSEGRQPVVLTWKESGTEPIRMLLPVANDQSQAAVDEFRHLSVRAGLANPAASRDF